MARGQAKNPRIIAKPAKGSRPSTDRAKEKVLQEIKNGKTVKDAMAMAGRSEKTYEYWRSSDEKFKNAIDVIRAVKASDNDDHREERAGDFEEFREKYLGMKTFTHQSQWIDLLEGREPRNLHRNQIYEPGDPQYILINTAPEHSKSMTISIDYVTYRICKDPNVRILIVSKTQELAKQFLYAVKQRLTHPRYSDLQMAFAPQEGFDGGDAVWQATMVYLGGESRDSSEKDPTINAIGIGGQIYGARADLIIIDDGVTLSNASQYESQIRWIQQEVITRLGPGGKLVVAGTRVDSVDLYRELRNNDRYPDGQSPWTYLAQPAVLEFAEDPKDWVTLWPKSNVPWAGTTDEPDDAGLYPRWDGPRLAKRRRILDPKTWSMVYMQADVSEDSTFKPEDIRACVNGNRTVGLISGTNQFHRRPEGMQGLYVVCSMDPAMAGETASIAYAVDIKTRLRYVLEAHRMAAPSPQQIRDLIKTWTIKYKPQAWIVEKNAFQLFLTRDEEIRAFLANQGCSMLEHYTGNNKRDPDFGVASLGPLFTERMIDLPSPHNCEGVKALIEQLITWRPGVKPKDLKQDLPMALWFAEIKVREAVESAARRSGLQMESKYTPRYKRQQQGIVILDEWARG